jgi:protease-4
MKEKRPLLFRIFGWIWRVAVVIYRTVIILGVVVFLLSLWFALHGGAPVPVKDHIALVIDPDGELVDEENPTSRQLLEKFRRGIPSQTPVRDLVDAIDDAAGDPRIAAAVLKLDDMAEAGMPQIEEIAAAIGRFRAAGKQVFAYGTSFDQAQYLLASSAGEVSLDPLGQVVLTGFGVYTNYFKDALDKLGVTVNVFRVGEFKSAVEPFERNDMSPEARAANEAWLHDLWDRYNAEVAAARKLQGAPADAYVAGFADGLRGAQGDAAAYAKSAGLIDAVEDLEAFRKRVGAVVGTDEDLGSFRQIAYDDYLRAMHYAQGRQPSSKVALVTVEGDIVDGEGGPGEAGGDSIADLIDSARRDDDVAALVLRVNSPGGSVTAAEKIRRAVEAVQEDGMPVVISMSNLAASGGYWISMGADEIWAHESTITGSIGIFGLWPTFEKPLDKLGVHTDGVGTTALAGAMRVDRPMSPELQSVMQSTVDFGYRQFIEGVAKGRDLSPERVQEIARGRVWSGEAAQKLGLVDKIGSLNDAVASAAGLADLKQGEYRVEEMEPNRTWLQEMLSGLTGDSHAEASVLADVRALHLPGVNEALALSTELRRFNDPRGLYALCLCNPAWVRSAR